MRPFSVHMGIFTSSGHLSPCMAISHLTWSFSPHIGIFTSYGHLSPHMAILTLYGHFHLMWPSSPCMGIFTSCGNFSPHVAILTLHGYIYLMWPFLTLCGHSYLVWTPILCTPCHETKSHLVCILTLGSKHLTSHASCTLPFTEKSYFSPCVEKIPKNHEQPQCHQ